LLQENSGGDVQWTVLTPDTFTSSGGAELKVLEDQSILASGPNAAQEIYTVTGQIDAAGWRGIPLEGLLDPTNTNGGAGRSSNTNVVLTEFEVYAAQVPTAGAEPVGKRIEIAQASADHEQGGGDFKTGNA